MRWLALLLLLSISLNASTYYVATNGLDTNPGTFAQPFLTVTKGVNTALAGDTVLVGVGTYAENVQSAHSGTSGATITIDGQNSAQINALLMRHSYNNVQNFLISGSALTYMIYMDRAANNCILSNNVVDAQFTPGYHLMYWNAPDAAPFGNAGSDNLVINNRFRHGHSEGGGITVYGDRNVIRGNFLYDSDNVDWLRVWGRTNTVVGNTFSNHFEGTGTAHADFYQVYGPTYGAEAIIIEQNKILGMGTPNAQLCMISPADVEEIRDITFRNNLFVDVPRKANVGARNINWLNNTFIRCASSDTTVLSFYVNTNSTYTNFMINAGHGCQVLNNIFLDCGPLTNGGSIDKEKLGWYKFGTNLTNVVADYNFVSKVNYQPVFVDVDHYVIGDPAKWNWTAWWETHGINGGEPIFTSPTDFRPFVTSPLINAATNLNALFTTDLNGVTRGSAWDIGAYQSIPFSYPVDQLDCAVNTKALRAYATSYYDRTCLIWPTNEFRTKLAISRRMFTNLPSAWESWTPIYTNTDTSVTNAGYFFDIGTTNAVPYEYAVSSLSTNWVCSTTTNNPFWTYEYINTGKQIPLNDTHGNVILLVESGLASSISAELLTLTNDLAADGYKIFRHNVASVDVDQAGWFNSVTNTKAIVVADYSTDSSADWTIFIVGHVPIPYSGLSSPGGHLDNYGAHPADWYYADTNETAWTDSTVNDTSATELIAHNVPGDGKFDQTTLPTAPEMRIGRVDFRNVTAFGKTEVQLIKQYLNRDHLWRSKGFTTRNLSLINTNNDHLVVHADTPYDAHNTYCALLGAASNIVRGSWLNNATNTGDSFLLAGSAGAGDYDEDMQMGPIANFAAGPLYIAFTSMYGSYYGDWDTYAHTNDILWAPLAADGYGLGTFYHEGVHNVNPSMAGLPVSQDLYALAANPYASSASRYVQWGYMSGGSTFLYNSGPRAYLSYLGDPTLRFQVPAPPTDVAQTTVGTNIVISWIAAVDTDIVGYHIYRTPTGNLNGFTRLTSTPTTSPYVDVGAAGTAYDYMVRTVKLEDSSNRSYYNASQGEFGNWTSPTARNWRAKAIHIGTLKGK